METATSQKRAMYAPISSVRGIPEELVPHLHRRGIKYTHQIFQFNQTQQQRQELAAQLGIPLPALTELTYRADLMRLHGVGGDMAHLLVMAGIKNCRELQNAAPVTLFKRLAELHISRSIAYHAPSLAQVRAWIEEANQLAASSPM